MRWTLHNWLRHAHRRFVAAPSQAVFLLLLTVFTTSAATRPPGEPAAAAETTYSKSVEVTATRIPEEAEAIPASLTVITGEDLRDWGATDLQSALALTAGVEIAPGGDEGPASSVPGFRGLKEFDAFLLVVDGVPWGGAFNPALASLDLHDVERIEVLRGPAPVMYGATSFVGVIQVVHANAADQHGSVSLSGGSFGSAAAAGSAKLPAWAGFTSSLGVDLEHRGYRDERTELSRGHLLWRNHRALGTGRLSFDVDGHWLDQSPASPHPRQGTSLTSRVPLDANLNPLGARLDERRLAVTTGYEQPLAAATWSTTLSFTRTRNNVLRGFLTEIPASGIAALAHGFSQKLNLTDIYFDSHLSWSGSGKLRGVAGIDHLHGSGNARGGDFDYTVNLDGSGAPDGRSITPDVDVHIGDRRDFSGAYGQLEWSPLPSWRFDGGVRANYTHERREVGPGDTTADEAVKNVTRLSGSVGSVWSPWTRGADDFKVYASYRNTFKPAAVDLNLAEGGEAAAGLLEPETARTYEAGVRSRVLGGRVALEVNVFQTDFRNLVVAVTRNGLPSRTNAGAERFRGVETSAVARLGGNFSARASASFHDARNRYFVTDFGGVATQLAGKRLEMSPHWLVGGGLSYAPARGIFGLVRANWVGNRFLNKRNTALAQGYATWAARLGWRAERWEVAVAGENLSNRRDPVAESELGDAQYYRLTARRVDLSAAYRF